MFANTDSAAYGGNLTNPIPFHGEDRRGERKVYPWSSINLIRTLPSLPYSTTHPEDVADNCEDHAYEALRIGLTFKSPEAWRIRLRF